MVQGSAVGGCRFVLRWFFAGMPFVAGTISSGVYFEQFLRGLPDGVRDGVVALSSMQ